MISRRAGILVGVVAVVAASVAWSVAGNDRDNDDRGGFVMPGSLYGVNPVYHPDIFGSAASAAQFGFLHTPFGWAVVRPERIPPTYPPLARAPVRVATRPTARVPLPRPRPVQRVPRAPVVPAIDYRVVLN